MHAARPYRSDLRWAGWTRQVPGAAGRGARGPVPSHNSSAVRGRDPERSPVSVTQTKERNKLAKEVGDCCTKLANYYT